jgi:hypothetical protein
MLVREHLRRRLHLRVPRIALGLTRHHGHCPLREVSQVLDLVPARQGRHCTRLMRPSNEERRSLQRAAASRRHSQSSNRLDGLFDDEYSFQIAEKEAEALDRAFRRGERGASI